MKVSKKQDGPVFQPVTLTIVFESQQELDEIKNMLSYDVSIPETVHPYDIVKQNYLSELICKLHTAVLHDQ